jgi:hypothetical protein
MRLYWWFAERVGPPSRNRDFFRGVDFVMGVAGSWQMMQRPTPTEFPLGGSAAFALEQEAVMRRSARAAVFATAAVVTSTAMARAEHASVTLSYSSAKSAKSCPDENTFRSLVAARLGYDPFVSAGVRTLAVDFERRGNEVVGRLDLSTDGDAKAVKRTLRTSAGDCFELATSMALVVAVAVDPNAVPGSTPPSATPAPPVPAPPASKTPTSDSLATTKPAPAAPRGPDRPERAGANLRLELAGLLTGGVVPSLSAGIRAGVGLDFGTWSVRAEGSFVSAGSRENPVGPGEVSAFALAGSLTPCVDAIAADSLGLELCAVGSLGTLRSTAKEVTRAAPTSTLLASLGPRVATMAMFSHVLGLGIAAEAPFSLSRAHLYIDDGGVRNQVWAQPRVGFIVAASIVASIP